MELTNQFIKTKRPCKDGYRWFLHHYQDGCDYQPLLDALVDDGRVNDACWLLKQFGPTNAVRRVKSIEAEAIVFSGRLEVEGSIDAASVYVGRDIRAKGGIRVDRTLVAGEDIRVGGSIWCGESLDVGGDIRCQGGIEALGTTVCGGSVRASWDLYCIGNLSVAEQMVTGHDLLVHGALSCGKGVRTGGSITVLGSINVHHGIESGAEIYCDRHLEAGWGIKAGQSIVSNGAVKAGESIQAEEYIRAGEGFGVYAGLAVPKQAWESSARVVAKAKPMHLLSGWWAGS